MLIKEYRIPLPLSVEEYRIAQLYMIQKKSRLDSTGEGSGVEIIENCPYKDGPGGSGQYTKKIYHIGNHIPSWLKAIVPKTALQVIEEAWNAYPYTKMKTTCPFVEKFYVDIETKYLPDNGSTENVFNLPPSELSSQKTDLIDPVKDPIPSNQYSREEDPLLYVSKKTGRGPLTPDWLQQPQQSIMCAYKRITVEFKYWGMQGKIEQFIHDGLRKPMLMGHRQAWVWQDEWFGLTISDIRELEKETQRMLAKKMGKTSDLNLNNISEGYEGSDETLKRDTIRPMHDIKPHGSTIELLSQESVDQEELSRVGSSTAEETSSFGWRIGSVTSSESEQEFFDAQDVFDSGVSDEECNETLLTTKNFDQSSHSGGSVESLDSYMSHHDTEQKPKKKPLGKTASYGGSTASARSTPSGEVGILVLVVHGGNPLELSSDVKSKENDCERLVREFENVMQNHYKEGLGRIAFRLVECPQMFKDALSALKDITPQLMDDGGTDYQGSLPSFNFPVSSLPLLAACSSGFGEMVDSTIAKANKVYREFLDSEVGAGFNGEVCIVGDCIGGLLAYEAMCLHWSQESFDTDRSSVCSGHPLSPVTSKDRQPVLQKFRRVSEHASSPRTTLKDGRLSSSDVDIRSRISEVDYRCHDDSAFDDLEESKHAFRLETSGSVSIDDGLDRVSTASYGTEAIGKFEFETSKFFAFGSPIGLVSLQKRFSRSDSKKGPPVKPACGQFYNLFHPFDPLSSRIEPLIMPKFSQMPPVSVPRYQKFPLGDGVSNDVMSWISRRTDLFSERFRNMEKKKAERQASNLSTSSALSWEMFDSPSSVEIRQGVRNWWGTERLDYALYNPKSLHQLPLSVLCPLFHTSYWESKDVVAFMMRQMFDITGGGVVETPGRERRERRLSSFHIPNPREKWLKKRTAYKIKNLASNHRANDAVALEGSSQIITARFTYGPLDVAALTGEKVDVYIMSYPPAGEWNLIDTMITGSGGRGSFTLPDDKKLDVGIYPVKMVVRGDHTTVDCSLAVLPPGIEAVVFTIDGSFSASVSLRGRHPKVQPGAVDVVRHWQEQGYLIIYVTSRPDFQKHQVMLWMAEHNFPFGLVSFCGSLSTVDIQRHKAEYLRNLTSNMKVVIHASYGSAKDVAVYSGLGVDPSAIFVIGKNSSRRNDRQATYLRDGYSSHLTSLANDPISRPPTGNSRITLRRGCFGLPRKQKHFSKRSFFYT